MKNLIRKQTIANGFKLWCASMLLLAASFTSSTAQTSDGFTLKDMTQRTVKTIEELTLHTIEQQKLIMKLTVRLDALEANDK
jgi:hypothetical protein